MHRVNCSQVGETGFDGARVPIYRARDRLETEKLTFRLIPSALPQLQSKVKLVSFSFAFLSCHSDNIGLLMLCHAYWGTAARVISKRVRVCLSA